MNWFKSFLGLYDKEQKIKNEEVAEYVAVKKEEFEKDMQDLYKQAEVVGKTSKHTYEEAVKLNATVEDITAKIAIATGKYKIAKKKI